jgi:predicted Zn-dependent protease
MKKQSLATTLLVAFVCLSACTTNTITGKTQLNLVSDAEILSTANTEYKQFLSTNKVVTAGSSDAASVNRVGNRIIAAVKKYYADMDKSAELDNYQWEINTVSSKEANAWCMPGGKIVVYTGILPITQNDAALAVVMGHEVTHALANHGKQRMNVNLIEQLGGQALSVALANKPTETQALFNSAFGLGSQYGVMLPFARKDEYEADKFGFMFTALAGYDPREAIKFWQRMSAATASSQKLPEFASTHPSDDNRIKQLQSIMDDTINKYYRP